MAIKSVFISYTASDFVVANAIKSSLEVSGLEVWFAPKDFNYGNQFDAVFSKIESADAVVALLSDAAIHSPWVKKEINLAIMNQLGGHPLMILPCYIDARQHLFALSDVKSIYLQGNDLDSGLRNIKDTLLDKVSDPSLQTLESYLGSFIPIPGLNDTTLWSLRSEAAKIGESKEADQVTEEILLEIEQKTGAELTPQIRRRIRDAVVNGAILPILPMAWVPFIRQFARRSDGLLLRFAEELSTYTDSIGVTRDLIRNSCAFILSEVYPEVVDEITNWQTSVIIAQAQQLGLLEFSTEKLSNQNSIIEFLRNPSFDIGPLAGIIGPLVGEFRQRQLNLPNDLK